jgi:hypothetical protein
VVWVCTSSGGWVIADNYDGGARGRNEAGPWVLVSVDWAENRSTSFQLPGRPFADLKWVAANAASIRRLTTGACRRSAGGNLALATAIAARDGGVQAPLRMLAMCSGPDGNPGRKSYQRQHFVKPLVPRP